MHYCQADFSKFCFDYEFFELIHILIIFVYFSTLHKGKYAQYLYHTINWVKPQEMAFGVWVLYKGGSHLLNIWRRVSWLMHIWHIDRCLRLICPEQCPFNALHICRPAV